MPIVARGAGKSLGRPPARILSGIDLTVADGEFLALTGRSGSGKSTLLYLLSSLDRASQGAVEADGRDYARMSADELSEFRNRRVGFVFQFHYLVSELDALDNALLPARKAGLEAALRPHAASLLERFGLGGKERRLPRELSGGEQQRLAIARSLVMKPKYLFADEPTGSLDTANGDLVMDLIRESNRTLGTTVVMVTHDPDFAALAGRRVALADGRLAET